MLLLISGEGKSDIGQYNPTAKGCGKPSFEVGPMSVIIDQLVEKYLGYEISHINFDLIRFISETELSSLSKKLGSKKKPQLRGKKRPKETVYYEKNARALAIQAKNLQDEEKNKENKVIAILFRDADGTQSSNRGEWQDKWDSMLRGFDLEDFNSGVPMLPNPKSEVWLLCALKENKYQHCRNLESESGNDHSANSLKSQLKNRLNILKYSNTSKQLVELISNQTIDVQRIDMPSFSSFKKRLKFIVSPSSK